MRTTKKDIITAFIAPYITWLIACAFIWFALQFVSWMSYWEWRPDAKMAFNVVVLRLGFLTALIVSIIWGFEQLGYYRGERATKKPAPN